MRIPPRRFAAALVLIGAATPLLAAPADDIRTRVAGLKELGAAFKSVRDALNGDGPVAVIQQAAGRIHNASVAQYHWFPAGSGPESGQKTAARAEIWAQPAKFKQAQDNFAAEATAFQKVAAGGNVDAIRAQAPKLAGACKGCHTQFRNDQ